MGNNEKIKSISRYMKRRALALCSFLLIALFLSQFTVLAILGTKGTEVSRLRQERSYYRLQNEKLRAEIDSARTLLAIESDINELFDLKTAVVRPLDVSIYSKSDDLVGLEYP